MNPHFQWSALIEDLSYIISGEKVESELDLTPSQKKVFLEGWNAIKKGFNFEDPWIIQEEVIDLVLNHYPYKELSPHLDWTAFERLTWLKKVEVLKQVFPANCYQVKFRNSSKVSG